MGIEDRQEWLPIDVRADWEREWVEMPSFVQEDLSPWKTIYVHFATPGDLDEFERLVGQKIARRAQRYTASIWYPEAEIGRYADKRWVRAPGLPPLNPRYPIYIVSKGRWESRLTVKALEKMGVPYRIVVEPQEADDYRRVIDPSRVLVLPFSNLGLGSIPARNWIWEYAKAEGHAWHWILDDNISEFYRLHYNRKIPVRTGAIFYAAEDFVERYENIAQAGFQYEMFAPRKDRIPAFYLNTRIYSCILLKTDLPYRWRGKYNEDTDLSLRLLKDGWCTVLFNTFLADKVPTMTMRGGNTDELYQGDGRRLMAESLAQQHPDVVKVIWRWGRHQHWVDYSRFTQPLRRRPDWVPQSDVREYGMVLEQLIDGEWRLVSEGGLARELADAQAEARLEAARKAEEAGTDATDQEECEWPPEWPTADLTRAEQLSLW